MVESIIAANETAELSAAFFWLQLMHFYLNIFLLQKKHKYHNPWCHVFLGNIWCTFICKVLCVNSVSNCSKSYLRKGNLKGILFP